MYTEDMYTLNRQSVEQALRDHSFASMGELANFLGVHRNSIARYLYGSPVFPQVLQRMLDVLELTPAQALKRDAPSADEISIEKLLASTVSKIVARHPDAATVLDRKSVV